MRIIAREIAQPFYRETGGVDPILVILVIPMFYALIW
jgi:hypothetical protein